MNELDDFFKSPNQPRIELRGPQTSGIRVLNDNDNNLSDSYWDRETDQKNEIEDDYKYVEYYKQQQIEQQKQISEREAESGNFNMDMMEQLSSMGELAITDQMLSETDLSSVYNKYSYRKPFGLKLPIDSFCDQVLSELRSKSVVIIEGPTGCGKTTQVPQWILDDSYARRVPCNIAVTQPRRIAAISIAKRVAHERGWQLGDVVGYQVGLDNKTTADTRLHYMTTGILLQKLVAAKSMSMYTHVILDEIHERGQEMDFLMLVVKKFLTENSPNVKVVLMSATFGNVKTFKEYFSYPTSTVSRFKEPSHVNATGKSQFDNRIYYLDNLTQFVSSKLPSPKMEEPCVTQQGNELVVHLLNKFNYIDLKEETYESNSSIPSVLIFLPGINEIEELNNLLEDQDAIKKIMDKEHKLSGAETDPKWWVVVLHSTITSAEQAKAFTPAPPGYRKIILATNIAESSITVPDIKYVIDFCLMRVLVSDPDTHFTSLQTQWASDANCMQRAGRAGRVRNGRVYRLVYNTFYQDLKPTCEPEIKRCPLERLVLLAKMLDMGCPAAILALAIDAPPLNNIRTTVLVLKEVGGLLKTVKGKIEDEDGDITYLGRIMAKLPVDIRISKLIVLGHIFGVLEPCIVMGAAMTVKNVFNTPFRDRLNAYNSKLTWADGSRSDCIAFFNLYQVWSRQMRMGHINRATERDWGRRMYIQVRALKELDDMVRELSSRLSRLHIEVVRNATPAWSSSDLPLILKVLITGAFYPYYYVQPAGDECRERDAFKQLNGLDPCTTVYLKDFPTGQPGAIYTSAIKKLVKSLIMDEPRVTFDHNSNKVYLSFSSTEEMNEKSFKMPGRVALPVYKAVKARQLNLDISIKSVPLERALALAEEMKRSVHSSLVNMVPHLPAITDTFIRFLISHMLDPGHFWIQNEQHMSELEEICNSLQHREHLSLTDDVTVGTVCLAPYKDNSGVSYYRAIVHQVMPQNMVWVFYMDYGNYGKVGISHLRELPPGVCSETAPIAVQCVLTGIGPSLHMGDTIWSQEARTFFLHRTMGKPLMGKVYSVAQGIVSLELLNENATISINQELIQNGFARRVEESYDSKLNHDIRETAQDLSLMQQNTLSAQQEESAARPLRDALPPDVSNFTGTIRLKGPYSPLESSLQTLMLSGQGKQVNIEWNSVNSVLLDTEPQEPYHRLVVAAQVGQNSESSKLTLRHTTVLPNIPGLPAIMALVFAPAVELRLDDTGSRYAAALCGLGAHHRDGKLQPFFHDHDLLVHFDVDITNKDIMEINHLRYLMNMMMFCPAGEDGPSVPLHFTQKVPSLARRDIISLLGRNRKHREFISLPSARRWTMASPEQQTEEDDSVIYPMHEARQLVRLDRAMAQKRLNEDAKLKDLVNRNVVTHTRLEVMCSLCGVGPMDLQSLRIHLHAPKHCDKVDELTACLQ